MTNIFNRIILTIGLILSYSSVFSQPGVYPDVVHYDITVSDINFATSSLSCKTDIAFKSTQNNTSVINLDLLKLTVDSIIEGNQLLVFTYNDTTLSITLGAILNNGDSSAISIYYHGQPQQDPSGWGGFYFSGSYAFNLGVGFDSDPHNLGKVWFPCVDNFTDRASYSFHITTAVGSKAFCNGALVGQSTNGNGLPIWHWQIFDRIPTYLASIAVAPYTTWSRNYSGIPVQIACLPSDSSLVSLTYQHLPDVLDIYKNAYGPYPFNKVGYCLIPFNSGAMEHATSIHIGKAFINGTLTYETLWAHELAHMWWGDHVTCETAGDIWLNEGFASFNEAYVTEQLYGATAYRDYNRSNHRPVLQFAHISDGGYLPLINIPIQHTYGATVYNKGADVARTLRHYLGDSLFYAGCTYYMNHRGDGSANSYDLRDDITTATGVNMNTFFDDWVFTPGFPQFSIDSVQENSGQYTIYTKQKSRGNTHNYSMPVEFTFSDGITDTTVKFLIDQTTNVFNVNLPQHYDWIAIDRYDHMADAVSDYERKIVATGGASFPETNVTLSVQATNGDTSIVRVEHNFVTPDPFKISQGIRTSDYHYWKVDGIFKPGFRSKAVFLYNGSTSGSTGHLDNTLITGLEDSLVMLYRKDASEDWQIVNGYTLNKSGSATDKVGNIVIDTLKKGEYTFGYYDFTTGITSNDNTTQLSISPNPSSDTFKIEIANSGLRNAMISIWSIDGKNVYNNYVSGDGIYTWKPGAIPSGEYIVRIIDKKMTLATKKVIYLK